MNINSITSPNFGWNIKTHLIETEHALRQNNMVSEKEKRMLGRFSQMPDLIKESTQDMNSAHFYDVLNPKDPSFGTKNDDINNAMSRFLKHTENAFKQTNRDEFLREVGYAAHYLQDAATPPHVENGNYLHKLYRLPLHHMFERGKKYGASNRSSELLENYKDGDVHFNSLEQLFHNTALFAVQKENQVNYDNIKEWFSIQQRCFNRSIDATKAYFDYMLKHLPIKNKLQTSML